MKQIIKKVLSIYMISTLVLSMLLSSLQRVSADESENIPNSPIKVLEENISDQSLYIKYYMTIDNQKFLYIENSKIVKLGALVMKNLFHNKRIRHFFIVDGSYLLFNLIYCLVFKYNFITTHTIIMFIFMNICLFIGTQDEE